MATYLVTGAAGLLGRHVVERLLARGDVDEVCVVAGRPAERPARAERVTPLPGEPDAPLLGLSPRTLDGLAGRVDHLINLAALHDPGAGQDARRVARVEGTRNVIEVARRVRAGCLHHVSSAAVAGEHPGRWSEDMFDMGQRLPSADHSMAFEAERLVRTQTAVPWRIYRPSVIIGHSRTGEMDRIDGPYHLFPLIRRLAVLPAWPVLPAPELGRTNVVPVDYVAEAMDHLVHAPGLDERVFHLMAPEPQSLLEVYNAFAGVAGALKIVAGDERLTRPLQAVARFAARVPAGARAGQAALERLGVPPAAVPHFVLRPVFDTEITDKLLTDIGLSVPPLVAYAGVLWRYWEKHLDPEGAAG